MSAQISMAPWHVHRRAAERYMETPTGQHYNAEYVAVVTADGKVIANNTHYYPEALDPAYADLIAAAPTQHQEMMRYLPLLERAEADPEIWQRLTKGTGIATLNAYRCAIAKATGAA